MNNIGDYKCSQHHQTNKHWHFMPLFKNRIIDNGLD